MLPFERKACASCIAHAIVVNGRTSFFASTASAETEQVARRPNGCAIGGAAHSDRGPQGWQRSTKWRHRAAAKPSASSLPAASSLDWTRLAQGPRRSRRALRLRLKLAVVTLGRFRLDGEAAFAVSRAACDSVAGTPRVNSFAHDGMSALAQP